MATRKKGDAYRDLARSGKRPDGEFAEALLKIIAVGVVGGLATIFGAKKLGEEMHNAQEKSAKKKEEQKKADKEAVQQAIEYEVTIEHE